MDEEHILDFDQSNWPADTQYAYGTETKDGLILHSGYKTVHGFWYKALTKDEFATHPQAKGVDLFQDEIVPANSPRVLNTTEAPKMGTPS